MSEKKLDLMKPFGPWVAKINIPEDLVNKLNDYVDKIIADEEKSKKQDAGGRLVGNVTQEFQVDFDLNLEPYYSVDGIYIPKKSKETEVVEGSTDEIVERLTDILKNEIKIG